MPKPLTQRQAGLKHGFRSGLEESVAAQLEAAGVPVLYEQVVIPFVQPEKPRKYTPDLLLPNGIIVETKGRWITSDRQKHSMVKAQFPDLDIRLVFSRSSTRISKTSKTTYADWCVKHGLLYADKLIPPSWLKEPPNKRSLKALSRLGINLKN